MLKFIVNCRFYGLYLKNMTKNLDLHGLNSIADNYDLFYIDLWGVVHNGINIHEKSIIVLNELLKRDKSFVLLTNAPRPNKTVRNFLEKMGMAREIRDHVFTSGEAALNYLKKNFFSDKFYHIGPPRDFDLFKRFEQNKVSNINQADYFICTGLFEDHETKLEYYEDLLEKFSNKKFVCTNPDLIVDRGDVREFCAGSVAKIFEKIGGKVIYFGKPYPPVYNLSANINDKNVLCIGDNMNTDIKGANIQNFDNLLITSGIHKEELNNFNINKLEKKYGVKINYTQSKLKW